MTNKSIFMCIKFIIEKKEIKKRIFISLLILKTLYLKLLNYSL